MNQNIYIKWQPLNISYNKQIAFLVFFFFLILKKVTSGDFPSCPVVKTSPSNAGGVGLIPCQGVRILYCLVTEKNKA